MTPVIAISGGSGSGKSTLAAALEGYLKGRGSRVLLIGADAFFKKELPRMVSPATGEEYYDWNHPTSVDMPALADALEAHRASGEYDYILLEGVTIFCDDRVRSLTDVRIFVDASIEMRIYRRIARNVQTKQQTIEFIGGYYLKFARFREKEYCLPSAKYSHWHVDNEWGFDTDTEAEKVLRFLAEQASAPENKA